MINQSGRFSLHDKAKIPKVNNEKPFNDLPLLLNISFLIDFK